MNLSYGHRRERILTESPTTHDKGLALELKLAELFKRKGYSVIHNTKRTGRSGAEHQIDLLVEFTCPLHTSQVIVEAKSYDTPINKDRIMKLIQIVDDLGADRGIIVTTSDFTPEAIKTAKGHNIELWNRDKLLKFLGEIELTATEKGLPTKVTLRERVARPQMSVQDAEAIELKRLEQRAKGGFLGKGKIIERLDSTALMYFPYYEAEIQVTVSEVEKTGFRSTKTVSKLVTSRVDLDARNGDIMTVSKSGIASPYPFLKGLGEDEVRVFRGMEIGGWYSAQSIAAGSGIPEGRARKMLSALHASGALESKQGYRGKAIFGPKVQFPKDPRLLGSMFDNLDMQEIPKTEVTFVSPEIEASDMIKRIEFYWKTKVSNISVVYYPRFICTLTTEDGSKRADIIDGITGELKEP